MIFAKLVQHHLTTWALLALPATPFLRELWVGEGYAPQLLYETGLWSVWLLVLALAISPATRLLSRWKSALQIIAIFRRRRRAIGVSSFGYAALHLAFYVRDVADVELIVLEAFDLRLAFGWLGFFALAAGAATSNKEAQRWLGPSWKIIQRSAYLAAAFTALHWWWVGQFLDELVFWVVLLAVLQLMRLAIRAALTSSALPAGTAADKSDRPYRR